MSALPPLLSMSARLLFVLLATSVARVLAATSDPVAPVTDPALQVPKGVTPLFDTWMRDTYVTLAADGHYYLTGTTAAPGKTHCWDWNDGIHVWRSDDLKHWEHLGLVWSLDRDATWQRTAVIVEPGQVSPARDVLDEKRRAVWAPEIHYIKSAKQWMIVACMNGERGSFILRSVSGKPEGPYENIAGNATKALFPNIDGSLFEDDDGAVYFVGHNHYIARMKPDLSGLAEPLAANPLPPRGGPTYALKQIGELNQYAQIPGKPPVAEALQRRLIHGYYAGVSYVDAQVGRVLAELERSGLAQNTIVVLWGDNGFSFGAHGDWTKHSNYEEANHIPVIFAGPGIAAGGRTPAMFETVDVYPTLAALAGLPAPRGPQPIDGASQAAVLRDPAHAPVKDFVYHAFPRGRPDKGGEWLRRAIRTARYRYVEWRPFAPRAEAPDIELYDYTADPLESENVAAQNPELCAKFQRLLEQQPAAVAPLAVSRTP